MGHHLDEVSGPARVAGPGDDIGREELALAARNHGLPLEALRYDVTPPGLHYTHTHYDIPYADATRTPWQLSIGGRVRRPQVLGTAELTSYPAVTRRVTMECEGNGRALLTPGR